MKEVKNAPNDLIHHVNSTFRVLSPRLLPSLTHRPTISSRSPSVNVAPDPPATSSTFSKSPRSMLHPPYGPSSITCTCTSAPVFSSPLPRYAWWSLASIAYRLSARVQSPITRAPRTIPAEAEGERQDVEGGALRMVSGCDSKRRPEKKTRS